MVIYICSAESLLQQETWSGRWLVHGGYWFGYAGNATSSPVIARSIQLQWSCPHPGRYCSSFHCGFHVSTTYQMAPQERKTLED